MITLVYWRKNCINYYPVPAVEADRIIRKYQRDGWGCEPYSDDLIKKLFKKFVSLVFYTIFATSKHYE